MRSSRLTLLGLVVVAGCADGDLTSPPAGAPRAEAAVGAAGPVVMTRNVYLGADIDPLLAAQNLQDVVMRGAQVWAEIQANDFARRAGILAAEIAGARPHLVGLQEVATFRIESPSNPASAATEVAYDYLGLLLDSLAARGAEYRVAAYVEGNDIELPILTPHGLVDVRFTQAEAILARSDVPTENAQGAPYGARINATIGGDNGPPISLLRAWASVDATVGRHAFRFISTHLEVQRFAPVQAGQASELLALADVSPLPVILVGDLNSAADGTQTDTYARLREAAFRDLWLPRGTGGFTCCEAKDLSNATSLLDQRIDYVLIRGFSDTGSNGVSARVHLVGEQRSAAGWGSDHAGVVAALRLPPGLTR